MLDRLKEEVVKPAIHLATQLQSCPEEYSWLWYSSPEKAFQKHSLDVYDIIDSQTHGQYGKKKFGDLPDGIVIGSFVLPLFPVVLRCQGKNGPNVAVAKGWVVVDTGSQKSQVEITRTGDFVRTRHQAIRRQLPVKASSQDEPS
ncbi:hypothetical protein N7492_005154 [Penicillium capsulatum]|uniref:Uncharacterized protein n=1 Tax=Penicillium capsulatum TaxID=69766 RepID=A0A9W9IBR8_9EURO|nr:hypothetical protein N7492_005154 [Penicillium capsulatum]KAJ6135741.1 hypothetical protein N7512_000901 [Penicillium capsulatum]